MFALAPISGDFFETADEVFTTMVELPASRAEIWSALVDNAGWEHWFEGCRSCFGTPSVWEAAGGTRTMRLGAVRIDEIAVELVPERRWVMAITAMGVPLAHRMAESIDLVDTSRDGEVRTELVWTAGGRIDRIPARLDLGPELREPERSSRAASLTTDGRRSPRPHDQTDEGDVGRAAGR